MTNDESEGGSEETRRGRFRVTEPSTGLPDNLLGKFRLIQQSSNTYHGSTTPSLQRGRFAVIPEEPHGSPGQSNQQRTSSPEWDFDDVRI